MPVTRDMLREWADRLRNAEQGIGVPVWNASARTAVGSVRDSILAALRDMDAEEQQGNDLKVRLWVWPADATTDCPTCGARPGNAHSARQCWDDIPHSSHWEREP